MTVLTTALSQLPDAVEQRRRDQLVAAAIADGRIPAGRRAYWRGRVDAPDGQAWLARLAPSTDPPQAWVV